MRSGTKGVRNSDKSSFLNSQRVRVLGTFGMHSTHLVSGTRDQLGLPRDLDVETREHTHDQEADTGVSDTNAV